MLNRVPKGFPALSTHPLALSCGFIVSPRFLNPGSTSNTGRVEKQPGTSRPTPPPAPPWHGRFYPVWRARARAGGFPTPVHLVTKRREPFREVQIYICSNSSYRRSRNSLCGTSIFIVVLASLIILAILPNHSSYFQMPGALQGSQDCHSTSHHYVTYLNIFPKGTGAF